MVNPSAVPFGSLLRNLRTSADLTLEQLAAAAGVSDRAISDMERGVSRSPRARTVEAVADGLGLTGEDRAALLTAARVARAGGSAPAPGGLPLPRRMADFTGRADELARVVGWTAGATGDTPAPVVVITGPPGIGKTTLAAQAAQPWAVAEQLFVDLRGLDAKPLTPAAVLGRLIRAADPSRLAVPRDTDEAAALWHTMIRGRRLVVVLDNAISESQVRPALPATGPAVVLVTSRRTLGGLEGVRRLVLNPLPADDAVTLLTTILEGTATAPESVRRIAELCVNIPLALRIAGNRLLSRPGWTADDLITRLAAEERRLDALAAGDLQIKAAFQLSYQQLTGVARRLFRRLALVPGSSTGVELAGVLVEEPEPVTEDALDDLVDLSLLQQRPDGRLQFHDLLRLYARVEFEREESVADRAAAIRRRDAWLLDNVVACGRHFEPDHGPADAGSSARAADWLRCEAVNWFPVLREVAEAGDDRRAVEVADALHWFSDSWMEWPYWAEVFTLSSRAAERLDDDRLRAVHLGYLAWVHLVVLQRPEDALTEALRALDCATRAGDRRQRGWAAYYVGWACIRLSRWSEALPYATEAVAEFRAVGDREGLPNSLTQQAWAVRRIGPADDAIGIYEEAVAVLTDPATAPPLHIARFAQVTALSHLADIEIDGGRWASALRRADAAVAAAELLDNPAHQLLPALSRRALVRARLTDPAGARADLAAIADLRIGKGVFVTPGGAVEDRIAETERLLAETV